WSKHLVQAGGPAYVKLGQLIATAKGPLPDAWTEAFAWCRDEVPPLRPGVAEDVIDRELGHRRAETFESIEPTPVAAASIARVPRPIPGLVTSRVLVMERVPGIRYTDAAVAHPELDGRRIVRLAVQGVLEHALLYGVFHGDLHAGNVLIDEAGNFSLVDFGIA